MAGGAGVALGMNGGATGGTAPTVSVIVPLRSKVLLEALEDRLDIGGGIAAGMPRQQRRLAADAVLDVIIAADDAGQRRLDLEELATGPQQRAVDAFGLALARPH